MLLNSIIWDVNPEIFHIGALSIRWYGILFALGFVFGFIIIRKIFIKESIPIKLVDTLTTYMVIGTVVGARLGHCFFYEPHIFLNDPLKILKIWEGGLASHGAAIGILIALFMFSKKINMPYMWIIDRIVIVVALAGFFIRMGNLMNSEVYGIETNLPWGFVFIEWGEVLPKHPTQIYEALSYLVIFIILYSIYIKKGKDLKQGYLFGLFLILLFSIRFLIEFIKEPQVTFELNMVLNMGQILSLPFILIGIFILLRTRKQKR